MTKFRKVADVQLSGNGYRKNGWVLDGARSMFETGTLSEFLKFSELYNDTASKILDDGGKVIYGPQNQASKNKNATDVHKRFSGLMSMIEASSNPSLTLADLQTVRDWKMVRNVRSHEERSDEFKHERHEESSRRLTPRGSS